MPNTWSYTLLLGSRGVTAAATSAALTIAAERDYVLSLPSHVFTNDAGELEYVHLDSLVEGLSRHGGLVSLWRASDDQSILLEVDTAANTIGYGTGNDFRAENEEERRGLVADLEALFASLCAELKPTYAYSTDEWSLEAAFSGDSLDAALRELERRVRCLEPPNVLFWLNYFDAAYWREIGESRLWIGANYTPLESGILLHLVADPSEARLATLGKDGRYHLLFR